MGYDGKYGRVITEHGEIPDDEPVIVFRARDITTLGLLADYAALCIRAGSPKRHLDIITTTVERFRGWQDANPQKVRVPDSERSRSWLGDRHEL